MRATAQDRDASQLMGININRTIAATFFIGAVLAGAGGIIWGLYFQHDHLQPGFRTGLVAFTSAVFGGIGNIPGAALGGMVIGLTAAFSDNYIGSKWTQVVIFGILIGVLVFPAHRSPGHAGAGEVSEPTTVNKRGSLWSRLHLRERIKDRDTAIYGVLLVVALVWPMSTYYATGSSFLTSQAAHAGTWVLLAIGLNVVVGFAGLLDLGYAAFFAIGAYCYALFASFQLQSSPLHHAYHLPFWLMLFVGMFRRRRAGAILGFPTLRLRGDYLAIVTLGFGEIVPSCS